MKLRVSAAISSAAFIVISFTGPEWASAADLGTFDLGDVISMPKDCDPGDDFADLHIASGHFPAWMMGDAQITDFDIDSSTTHYSYDTTAQGVGDFTVIIHCWSGDPHDPISQEYIYTFTVAAVAATTTTTTTVAGPGAPAATTTTVAIIPEAGTSSTTSLALIAAVAMIVGAALLLVRRRSIA